jgi:nicotinamidase-related amidase
MTNNGTALLVMDTQLGILGRLPNQGSEVLRKIAEAIQAARDKNIPVIFVRLGFRKGFPEISTANKMFTAMKNQLPDENLNTYMQIHPGLGLKDGDIIVDKKRVSAFSGSDLEIILRSQYITHLVFTGVATSGIVLSTLCAAFDKDYQLTVLSDGCADADVELHEILIQKMFSKRAEVVTIEEWKTKP